MPRNETDTVRQMLDLLRDGLLPFVETQMRRVHGAQWKLRATVSFKGYEQGAMHFDTPALLKVILDNWDEVFDDSLNAHDRSLIYELRNTRNLWAHQKELTSDDIYRSLDNAHRLLSSIRAEAADEAKQIKFEHLISQTPEIVDHLEQIYINELSKTKGELQKANADRRQADRLTDATNTELAECKKSIENVKKELDSQLALLRETKRDHKNALAELEATANGFERELQRREDELKVARTTIKTLQSQLHDSASGYSAHLQELEFAVNEAEERSKLASADRDKARQYTTELEKTIAQLQQETERHDSKVAGLGEEIYEKRQSIAALSGELEEVKRAADRASVSAAARLQIVQNELGKLESDFQNLRYSTNNPLRCLMATFKEKPWYAAGSVIVMLASFGIIFLAGRASHQPQSTDGTGLEPQITQPYSESGTEGSMAATSTHATISPTAAVRTHTPTPTATLTPTPTPTPTITPTPSPTPFTFPTVVAACDTGDSQIWEANCTPLIGTSVLWEGIVTGKPWFSNRVMIDSGQEGQLRNLELEIKDETIRNRLNNGDIITFRGKISEITHVLLGFGLKTVLDDVVVLDIKDAISEK